MAATLATTINELPDVILSNIIASISDVRSRNSAAIVCRKWYQLERATRAAIALRGNLSNLFLIPTCFPSISHLDVSLLSPWGHSLTAASDPELISYLLHHAFPSLSSITLYARNPPAIQLVARQWPDLKQVKLVRWHQRPQVATTGEELKILFQECGQLKVLDLSSFYCWTDDVPPALESHPAVASNLTSLNILNSSFSEGFKSDEIKLITKFCPNLKEFRAACMFDPRYIGFVGDEALISVSTNCPKLSILHLADTSALSNARGNPDHDGFAVEDAKINAATLIEVFSGLPLLLELALDVCNNVRDSGPALEVLNSRCPKLKCLKLGQFHGISMPIESKLDGVAVCQMLSSLSIRNVGDLNDMGLIAIARGCCRLAKFEVEGCKKITMRGMRTLACLLRRTLVDVRISCCKNLGAASGLKALEPLQKTILRLHIDCVWDCGEEIEDFDGIDGGLDLNLFDQGDGSKRKDLDGINGGLDLNLFDQGDGLKRKDLDGINGGLDLNLFDQGEASNHFVSDTSPDHNSAAYKKRKYSNDSSSGFVGVDVKDNGFHPKTWDRLQYLSLWIEVGQLLTPLQSAGLENCPNLEEIQIKVEGDCREMSKPSQREFGLSILMNFPRLTKMHLDCGDCIGYAHTAPSGQMDLSLWERFYLFGIGQLSLTELDYWPPQDRDVNQRSLSLPAAGLLQECFGLRRLFIHGTAHEHFMMFLLRIPDLRDFQLREDYYPAPENDMSTEMRVDSCSRFEAALNRRRITD